MIKEQEIVELEMLRKMYTKELDDQGFSNDSYRGEKLQDKILNHELSNQIGIAKIDPGKHGWLRRNVCYSSSMTFSDTVQATYDLAHKDTLRDAALILRNNIWGAQDSAPPLPWPPTADELDIITR